jgi:antitoxin HigA-1
MAKKRRPTHPGIILDEDYIKPLNLNLQKLAERLGIARNTLFKIRAGKARITPAIAIALAEAFDTTPHLWLNLQQNFDLWIEENEFVHEYIQPIVKNGKFIPIKQNIGITRHVTT